MGLDDAADWVKGADAPIRRWFEDDTGRYAFKTTIDGTDSIVAAKQYLHDGTASVFRRLALRAADTDSLILLWVDQSGRRLVFDASAILSHGDDRATRSDERQNRQERWVDFPARWGVDLVDYVEGRDTPTDTDDIKHSDGGATSLDDFGGGFR